MPLAFFCTLFFRHRKKSVSAPWDGKSQSAPESARQSSSKGNFLRLSYCLMLLAGWLSARPPAPPSGSRRANGVGVCTCGRTKGLSSGQTIGAVRTAVRSACCLPELRFVNRSNRAPHWAASPAPAPESARQAPPTCPNIKIRRRIIPPADWNSLGFLPAASAPSKNGKQSACGRLPPPR